MCVTALMIDATASGVADGTQIGQVLRSLVEILARWQIPVW
jgi:hypothetical protein